MGYEQAVGGAGGAGERRRSEDDGNMLTTRWKGGGPDALVWFHFTPYIWPRPQEEDGGMGRGDKWHSWFISV